MAEYSDQVVNERVGQILAEKGNTAEARAQIAREAKAAGVGAGQLARALNLNRGNTMTEADVRRAAYEAGESFGTRSIMDRQRSGDLTKEQADELRAANVGLDAGRLIGAEDIARMRETGLSAAELAFMDQLPEGSRGIYEQLMSAEAISPEIQRLIASGVTPSEIILATTGVRPTSREEAESVIAQALAGGSIDPATAAYARENIVFERAGEAGEAGEAGVASGQAPAGATTGMGTLVQATTFYKMPSGQIGSVGPGEYLPYGAIQISEQEFIELARSQGLEAGIIQEGEIPGETPQPVPGEYVPFQYTPFTAGGIYGPGQGLPSIFQPAGQQPVQGPVQPQAPVQGPTTMMSPAVTTYAYPSPFGNVDIFNRPLGS